MGQKIDMEWGYVEFGNPNYRNEVLIVSTVDDPPLVRMSSRTGGFGGMCWSKQRPDGLHETVGILQGKLDERFRHDPKNLAGELTLHLRQPKIDNDAAQIHILTARHDGVQFHVPIVGAAVQSSQSRFYSGNGRYCINVQDDGNIVEYDTHNSHDETTWTAVWTTGIPS